MTLAAVALAGCWGGGTVTVTVACPSKLVSVDHDPRPERPERGVDNFADLDAYAEALGSYATGLELQASAREAQVAECRELTAED